MWGKVCVCVDKRLYLCVCVYALYIIFAKLSNSLTTGYMCV